MEVREQIDILVELQRKDVDADAVRTFLSGIAQRLQALEGNLASAEAEREAAEADLAALRKDYRSLESDVKANLELIRKSKSRLPGIKTNKEYQALLKAMEETEKKNSRFEDEMLELLDRIEAGEKGLEQRKQECVQADASFTAEKARLESESREGEIRLAEIAEARDRTAQAAPPELIKIFTRIQKQVESPMIVPVRGNTCEGCNIQIPPQMANELRRFESLNFCPFCNRLIYWQRPSD
ncbi:zinc ribbon domain-containing protein [Desulfococcus sp.]|uniref:zinc ribbon domain-containing protein n=1 Tax=Desulfococcus sp. TaxID=2025834 RepID=UPI003592EC1B